MVERMLMKNSKNITKFFAQVSMHLELPETWNMTASHRSRKE
jgi:hypothetical protein